MAAGLRTTTLRVPGLLLLEHELEVPLAHPGLAPAAAGPQRERLSVFAREVRAADDPDAASRPLLVFLQGGPGNEAPRPTRRPTSPSWLDRALRDYRVLLVDQRGTGRSVPAWLGSPEAQGVPRLTPRQQADRLVHFRADAIVADCEALRAALGVARWSVLGQSFGGFCALRYLSVAPGSLDAVLFTGGVPPLGRPVEEVYAATYATMRERNAEFHATYPQDRARLERLLERSSAGAVVLPGGDPVGPERLRQVGSALGMSDGPARLHALLERDPRSRGLAHDLASMLPFGGRDPLYAVLQEACYADGGRTAWAAQRCLPQDFRDDPGLLTGEHVFPSSLREDSELTPLADAAELLAHHDWPRLYDEEALAGCGVPAAAAVYARDPYVDRVLSLQTVDRLPTLEAWVSSEHEHNGLRADGAALLDRLLGMVAAQRSP